MLSQNVRALLREIKRRQRELQAETVRMRQWRRELEERERRLGQLFDSAPLGCFAFNRKGLVVKANATAAGLLGRDTKGLLFSPFTAFVHEGDRETFVSHLRQVFRAKVTRSCELRLVRPDRSVVQVLLQSISHTRKAHQAAGCHCAVTDITPFKQTQEMLEQQLEQLRTIEEELGRRNDEVADSRLDLERERARYRELFDFAPDGYLLTDLSGRIQEANLTAHDLLGQSWGGLVGMSLLVFIATEDLQRLMDVFAAVKNGQRLTPPGEVLFRASKDKSLFCEVSVNQVRDATGKLVGLRWSLRDIAPRKLAEQKHREAERKYRELVRHAPAGIYEIDFRARRFVSVNDAMCELTGYSRVELLAMDPLEILQPQEHARFEARVAQWLRGEKPDPNVDYRIRTKDGRTMHVVLSVTYTKDAAGNPVGATVVGHDVTERKKAEEAVRESEEKFRAFFHTAAVGTAQLGLDGRFIDVNDRLCHMTGYSREELLQMKPADLWHPEDRELDTEHFSAHLHGQISSFDREKRYIRKDGQPIWVQVSAALIRDAAGKPMRSVGVIQDITERKRAREALRESERRYRALFDTTSDGVWIHDLDGKILEVNDAYCQMSGYTREELKGMHVSQVEALENPQAVAAHIQKLLESGGHDRFESSHRRKDGSVFDVDITALFLGKERGQIATFTRDITERKRAQEALRESEQRFRTLANGTPLVIWITDAQGRNRFVNRAFCEFFGVQPEAVQDFGWGSLIHPDDAESHLQDFMSALRARKLFRAQVRVRRHDGTWRWIYSYGEPRFSHSGEFLGLAGSSLDVTERREFEMELERMVTERTQLLQRTVAELEHFSYTITHDMRAPLRAMNSFGDLLLSECADCLKPARNDYIRRIQEAASRMDTLITDALNYSKAMREELDLEPIEPRPLLLGMLESYPQFQPPNAEITVGENIPPVLGNKAALIQCFSNLLGNAVKFVPAGRTPKVRVWAESTTLNSQPAARIYVEDNGIGIAPEYQDQIWTMFQKLDNKYEGTGVGLALVRKVVERMKGQAGVESQVGQGSRFWVVLNRA